MRKKMSVLILLTLLFTSFSVVKASVNPLPAINFLVKKSNTNLTLEWNDPLDASAIKYNIYRSEQKNELGALLHTFKDKCSIYLYCQYNDSAVGLNKLYYYTVKSVNSTGEESIDNLQLSGSVVLAENEKPDLAIKEIIINQTYNFTGVYQYGLNTTIKIGVQYYNQGGSSAAKSIIGIYVDGVLKGEVYTNDPTTVGLVADPNTSLEATYTLDRPGSHEIKAIIDDGNKIDEQNENNNIKILSITVLDHEEKIEPSTQTSQSSNIKLGDGTYELDDGDKVQLNNGLTVVPIYFVSGSGSNEFLNVKFDVYKAASKITTTDYTRVAWDTKIFNVSQSIYSGYKENYIFKVYVESLGRSAGVWKSKITFKSENVSKPDLTIKDIYIENNLVKVKYCNDGGNPIDVNALGIQTFYIKISANDRIHKGTSNSSNYIFQVPNAGQCANTDGLPVDYFNLTAGKSYPTTAVIDHLGEVNETNENNNTFEKTISVSGGDVNIPNVVSEKVKCVFKDSQTEQKCYAAVDNNGLSCSGKESCVIDVKRPKGEKMTWKSSCGGYAYTTMDGTGGYDGRGEYAEFDCSPVSTAPAVSAVSTPAATPMPAESKVEIIEIKYKAKDIVDNKYDSILAELKQLRDTVKEQQTEIKYLKSMTSDLRKVSEAMKSAINDFITYGVDANTVKLGAGERAAVINSYKAAFAKLPETEAELTDAIKIANGRFPSVVSDTAEKQAKEQFIKIYKRIPDLNDAQDNAAIKVMAYGLRQKAENRNLNSEKSGIKTFKAIYGYNPKTTEDWNTMQAITYSGASREKDTDGDLLSDEMEEQYGTDPKKSDSDGDGFKDGVEVNGGFNPKGEGKL